MALLRWWTITKIVTPQYWAKNLVPTLWFVNEISVTQPQSECYVKAYFFLGEKQNLFNLKSEI